MPPQLTPHRPPHRSVDIHLRKVLAALKSPARWVRQAVGLSLSAVHASSLVVVAVQAPQIPAPPGIMSL